MKLLFYDKFFDALFELPKQIQKKVLDFRKKFTENSKAASINLETISTFKDKTLRSARIDQTYRAIIKVPKSGNTFYLVWVDHHDKAYEWATNKIIQWNEETQAIQVFTAIEEVAPANDVEKATEVEQSFISSFGNEQLIKIGVPEVLLPVVLKINNFDDLEAIEKYLPNDVFENLFCLLDGGDIDALITEVNEGKIDLNADIDHKSNSINNQRNFIELADDTSLDDFIKVKEHKWKYYLHPSQRKLVASHFNGTVKVSGGAGTGKTVAALHRLKFLSESISRSEEIIFTTFTNALADNLKILVKGLDIEKAKYDIKTIDSLVGDIIKSYKVLPEGFKVLEYDKVLKPLDIWEELIATELCAYTPEFLNQEFTDVILYNNVKDEATYIRTSRAGRGKPISRMQRKEVWALVEKFIDLRKEKQLYFKGELFNKAADFLSEKNIFPYAHCIVDELQDFSNTELRFIRSLVETKENDLFLVGDPMQNIYNKKIVFSKVGISVRGRRSRRLKINYRTTEEIKKLALSVIQDCEYNNFDGEPEDKAGYVSLYHGDKPTYQTYASKQEEVNTVLEKLLALLAHKNLQYSDIAICSHSKSGLKDFMNAIHKNNLPFSNNSYNKSNNEISLLTFHKIKGLEFKYVFLVDINDRSFPKRPFNFNSLLDTEKHQHIKKEKSMVYVAVSRAIDGVFISGIGKKSVDIDI